MRQNTGAVARLRYRMSGSIIGYREGKVKGVLGRRSNSEHETEGLLPLTDPLLFPKSQATNTPHEVAANIQSSVLLAREKKARENNRSLCSVGAAERGSHALRFPMEPAPSGAPQRHGRTFPPYPPLFDPDHRKKADQGRVSLYDLLVPLTGIEPVWELPPEGF